MRRQDRAMDETFAREIIDEAPYGVLALSGDEGPYGLPLSIVRQGDQLFFHTAKEGHKYDFIQEGAPVWAVFVTRVQVPDLFSVEEMDEMLADPTGGGRLAASVFTTEFASAMVGGNIHEISEPQEKEVVLRLICQKYTPDKMKYVEAAIASGGDLTRVFAIDMAKVTAKRKKYDGKRQEMKFGRME